MSHFTGTASFPSSTVTGAGNLLNLATFDMVGAVTVSTANFSQEGVANVIGTGSFNSVLNRVGNTSNAGTLNLTQVDSFGNNGAFAPGVEAGDLTGALGVTGTWNQAAPRRLRSPARRGHARGL